MGVLDADQAGDGAVEVVGLDAGLKHVQVESPVGEVGQYVALDAGDLNYRNLISRAI